MAAETHPSSSSSNDNYDVFLSFRGKDTRRNFTDHLYHALMQAGIQTFRDNEELHHGEEIGPKLFKSIEQSRISIPIFSKNYASSKWCLRELTKIMECKKTHGQIVWPIFYKVVPSHVKNQTGCFEEAFLKHEEEQEKKTVRAWRQALKEVANLKGWDSEDPKYSLESNLIKSIVEMASKEVIQNIALHVAKHPTGIESRVEEVMRMLDVESQGVLFVGIHGMCGIGKTTMAKAIFNELSKQFESRSFLANVRGSASELSGLVNLQNILASNLLKGINLFIDNVDRGINVIKKQLCKKQVLIVLDDVDHDEQLHALAGGCDWFGSGSRIIITTRDEHILHENLVDKSKIYKLNELDESLSLQLFSKHAFGEDQPPQDLRKLSKGIVSILGGLPLALEILGCFLRDKEHTDWEDTLERLKKYPNEKVWEKLKISYDRLDEASKKLFLDIACFFIGMDKESVIPACEEKVGIKVLVQSSLVKIDSDNKLRMHDQLRDIGREIVRQESPMDPGERSRLWSHEEALDTLKQHKYLQGKSKVEGLFLDFRYQAKNHWIDFYYEAKNYWTDSYYEQENYLINYDYEEEDYSIEPIVKIPQIDPPDLLTEAFKKMSYLRLLQVDHADHDRNNFEQLPRGLKWLSLKGISAKCVPKISHLRNLAVLDLSGSNITDDDWSGWHQIQLFRTLKVLDLSSCSLLKRTPHFSRHTGLERLILDRCTSLVAFDESIEHLQKLVFLSLKRCENLTELPDSICKLSSIRSLILSQCFNLEKLPNLSNLKSLQALCLSDCRKLFEIQGMSGLSLLQQLDLDNCRELKLLPELPPGLIKLNMGGYKAMERLPNLSTLKNLKELHLYNCFELAEIEGIHGLTLIQKLDLTNCRKLQSLPELPSSLIKLNATYCSSIKRLTNLSHLKILQALLLCDCHKLAEIEGIDGLIMLQELDLRLCKELQSLPELPSSLIKLDARGCWLIKRLPNLSNLKNLQVLHLFCGNLSEIQDISGLSVLQELDLEDCKMLQSLRGLPPSLIRLYIEGWKSMKRLPNLSSLRSLEVLRLNNCMNLDDIQGINDLTLLQELDLQGCSKLQSVSELPSSLTRLNLQLCYELQSLPKLPSNLISLDLEDCHHLVEIQGLEKVLHLH